MRTTQLWLVLALLACLLAAPSFAAPIHDAAARGDVAALDVLLKDDPALVNARDEMGATPLHWAADKGGRAMAEALLARGADINAAKNDGVTPLHVAVALGNREIVELLLDKGATIDSKDRRGRTPYWLARQREQTEIADFVASRGASTVAPALSSSGRAVSFSKATINGFALDIITVDTLAPGVHLSAAISQRGIGGSESFGSFIKRYQPTAAINGTLFCTQTLKPIGDIVLNGKLVNFGGMGTGLCVAPDNKVCFVPATWQSHTDWSAYETVVCSGPRLMLGGAIDIDTKGHRDPHVLGRGVRMAVGVTAQSKLLMVATRKACSLTQLAGIMSDLGCTSAVNLDGGASIGMYCDGRMVRSPGRALTNVLLVYQSKPTASAK